MLISKWTLFLLDLYCMLIWTLVQLDRPIIHTSKSTAYIVWFGQSKQIYIQMNSIKVNKIFSKAKKNFRKTCFHKKTLFHQKKHIFTKKNICTPKHNFSPKMCLHQKHNFTNGQVKINNGPIIPLFYVGLNTSPIVQV